MAKYKDPLVSIVTPVYNGGKTIAESIDSVFSQTYTNWEYIILDNCSNDQTGKILEKYKIQDNRIKLYKNTETLPVMKNHNRALGFISSDSKYCKILHADDWIFPTCIESMVKIAEENHRIAIVGSYGLWGNEVACDGLPYPEKFFDGKEICRRTLQGEIYPFLSPSSTMMRSDIVRKKSNFYDENNLHADVEVCYEILNSNDFGFVHQILTYIRRHDQSLTSTIAYKHDMLLYSNMDLLTKFGPKYLKKEKFIQILNQKLNGYYKVLGQNKFKKMPKGYHEFHRKKLSEMGLKYDYLKIGYYAIKYLIGEIGSKVYH